MPRKYNAHFSFLLQFLQLLVLLCIISPHPHPHLRAFVGSLTSRSPRDSTFDNGQAMTIHSSSLGVTDLGNMAIPCIHQVVSSLSDPLFWCTQVHCRSSYDVYFQASPTLYHLALPSTICCLLACFDLNDLQSLKYDQHRRFVVAQGRPWAATIEDQVREPIPSSGVPTDKRTNENPNLNRFGLNLE
jgi:hypothetical protein